jgi:hypothetical protein
MERIFPHRTDLGHVHVVDEVDEFLVARRTEVSTCLLLEWFLEHALQHLGCRVEVKRDVRHGVVFAEVIQLLVDDDRLAETGIADQHDWPLDFHEHVHEVADASCFGSVDERRLRMHKVTRSVSATTSGRKFSTS